MLIILSGHSLGGTHLFETSSMTVPLGHSHPLTTQTAGQGLGMNLLLHVVAQRGSAAHSFTTCPST